MDNKELFTTLAGLNVNEHKENRKSGNTELSYLSWVWALSEFTKVAPDFDYEIKLFQNEKGCLVPYMYDEATGYMVMTSVTVNGKTKTMWLPVMDGANKAMKKEPYQYKTKYDTKSVEAATMFDVNKAIMRCLTKNLAMFGLGLYIYAGEDLPENDDSQANTNPTPKKPEPKPEPDVDETEEWKLYWGKLQELCPDRTRLNGYCKEQGLKSTAEITRFRFEQIKKRIIEDDKATATA